MPSLQKLHALQKVGSELYERYKSEEVLMQTAIDMYTIFYYPKKEIAHKLFWNECETSVWPVIIMLDILFQKRIPETKRVEVWNLVKKYNSAMKDTSPEMQRRRWKLWWRTWFSKQELERLQQQRKNPLPEDIRQELFGMFKWRKEISIYNFRESIFDIDTRTQRDAYVVLSEYLLAVHGIQRTPAALKSIISRLKKADKENSAQ